MLNRWKHHSYQLFDVCEANVKQNEIHSIEPLVPEPECLWGWDGYYKV